VTTGEFTMDESTQRTELLTLGDARPVWERPETVLLNLEDVESAADVDVVFASSCCKTCDID
jgi:hypothetical protein